MELLWRAELEDGSVFLGNFLLNKGENHVACDLPEGILKSVTAMMLLPSEQDEHIFMNGYQSWTYCPEYTVHDYTCGFASRLAEAKPLALERYGDYYFVDYPETPGITHGESFAYWRRGERFRLLASLDETPGYTIFCYDAHSFKLTL